MSCENLTPSQGEGNEFREISPGEEEQQELEAFRTKTLIAALQAGTALPPEMGLSVGNYDTKRDA